MRTGLQMLLATSLLVFASGCSQKHRKVTKSFVIVEKPPFRVLYVTDKKEVDRDITNLLLQYADKIAYQNTEFNEQIVGVSFKTLRKTEDSKNTVTTSSRTMTLDK